MLIMKINFLRYLSLFNLSINSYFSMEKDVVEIEKDKEEKRINKNIEIFEGMRFIFNNKEINELKYHQYKNIDIIDIFNLNNYIKNILNKYELTSINDYLKFLKKILPSIYEDLLIIYKNNLNIFDVKLIELIQKDKIINLNDIDNIIIFLNEIKNQNNILLREINLNKKCDLYLVELYKNISLFFIANILDIFKKDSEEYKNILQSILDYSFDASLYSEILFKNKFILNKDILKNIPDINNKLIEKFNLLNINIKISENSAIYWEFQNQKELFKKLSKLNINENMEAILISNNGGKDIMVPNNNINFFTSGNCSIFAINNFIIGSLFYIDNTFINNEIKKDLKELIIKNIINFVKDIKNISISKIQKNAISNHENISEEKFFEIFDLAIEDNEKKILENGICKNNKELINFFIKLHDILLLVFKGNYKFEHNDKLIEIKNFSNKTNYQCIFYSQILNCKNANKIDLLIKNKLETEKIKFFNNFSLLFGHFNQTQDLKINEGHIENIIYLDNKILEEYKDLLINLNELRPGCQIKNTMENLNVFEKLKIKTCKQSFYFSQRNLRIDLKEKKFYDNKAKVSDDDFSDDDSF